jgi:hypothetical protein
VLPVLLLLLTGAAAGADGLRDPLEPPPAARPPTVASEPAAASALVVHHIISIDGRRWLLDGARRYGVGDQVGGARIVCIVDTGVVVQEAGVQRLLPIFAGVVIQRPGPAASGTRPARAGAPRPLCPSKDK